MREMSEVETIRDLCERRGYGRVMQIAADLWKAKDPIGALTVGPCVGLLNRESLPQALLQSWVDRADIAYRNAYEGQAVERPEQHRSTWTSGYRQAHHDWKRYASAPSDGEATNMFKTMEQIESVWFGKWKDAQKQIAELERENAELRAESETVKEDKENLVRRLMEEIERLKAQR